MTIRQQCSSFRNFEESTKCTLCGMASFSHGGVVLQSLVALVLRIGNIDFLVIRVSSQGYICEGYCGVTASVTLVLVVLTLSEEKNHLYICSSH